MAEDHCLHTHLDQTNGSSVPSNVAIFEVGGTKHTYYSLGVTICAVVNIMQSYSFFYLSALPSLLTDEYSDSIQAMN